MRQTCIVLKKTTAGRIGEDGQGNGSGGERKPGGLLSPCTFSG